MDDIAKLQGKLESRQLVVGADVVDMDRLEANPLQLQSYERSYASGFLLVECSLRCSNALV